MPVFTPLDVLGVLTVLPLLAPPPTLPLAPPLVPGAVTPAPTPAPVLADWACAVQGAIETAPIRAIVRSVLFMAIPPLQVCR
jgi:hypothetical protein